VLTCDVDTIYLSLRGEHLSHAPATPENVIVLLGLVLELGRLPIAHDPMSLGLYQPGAPSEVYAVSAFAHFANAAIAFMPTAQR